ALGWIGARLRRRVTDAQLADADSASKPLGEPRVIVAGYGRVGKLIADMLSRHDIAWVAIDADPHRIDKGREAKGEMVFGDASRPEMLKHCGLEHAPAVVVTLDDPEAAAAVTAAVRRIRPDVVLVSRARDAKEARKLYELGATDAVPETIESSLQLSEAVLVDIGVPMGLVIASIHEKRDEIRAELNPRKPKKESLRPAGGASSEPTARSRMKPKPAVDK
ncbi:MAG: NAD-binding protein, partial [Caulobacteraceae bacterium]